MKLNGFEDLYGALVSMGADTFLVETEEEAQGLMKSIEDASIERELKEDEFEEAKQILNLKGHIVMHIYSFVNGSEFFVCLSEDWI